MEASLEYYFQMVWMTHSQTRMSSKIIQIHFDNYFEIMKIQGHSLLKGGSRIFNTERILLIFKRTPRKNKCSFMLIVGFDMNLIISRQTIHK